MPITILVTSLRRLAAALSGASPPAFVLCLAGPHRVTRRVDRDSAGVARAWRIAWGEIRARFRRKHLVVPA